MSVTMRAKLVVNSVEKFPTSERLNMSAVGKTPYPDDGSDEDNTYAVFSPQATFSIVITNHALLGKFIPGDKFYVDFTPAG